MRFNIYASLIFTIIYLQNGVSSGDSQLSDLTTFPNNSTGCCYFSGDDCGVNRVGWYWSQETPAATVPIYSGSYLWTDDVGAQVTFPTIYTVSAESTIAFNYYINSLEANIAVYFIPTGQPPIEVAPATSIDYWAIFSEQCINCCKDESNCTGQISLQTVGTAGIEVAVDNFEVDGECHDSMTCCDFDDYSRCMYTSEDSNGYHWNSSRNSSAINPPPTPGSNYVYFETVDYIGPYYLYAKFSSFYYFTLYDNSTMRGNFYVNIANVTTSSALQINIYNTNEIIEFELGVIKSTGGEWQMIEFDCQELDCCGSYSACTAMIEFYAYVEAHGGTVLYAIDGFEIKDACNYP
ncbi:hypothetical protein CHUAL_008335 [Chamberlinius hualienensis]